MAQNAKLAAAMHYLIARLHPSHLGATKLNKVLWFADCEHFRRHGKSITGQSYYVRRQNGPCVEDLEGVLSSLKASGAISEQRTPTVIGYDRREFKSHVEPDVSVFTAEEVDLLLEVAKELARLSATEASDLSHDALWEETMPSGRISVAAGAVKVTSLDIGDHDWARAAFA